MDIDERVTEGISILTIHYDHLDAILAPQLRAKAAAIVARGHRNLAIDLARVRFIDSAGLGALVAAHKAIGPTGLLVLIGARDNVRALFRVTKMDTVFRLVADEAAARAAFPRPAPAATTTPPPFRMAIDSDLARVAHVGVAVRALCVHDGVAGREADRIGLAVVEAVSNAIVHAYERTSGHEVGIRVDVTAERVLVQIEDQGRSMLGHTIEHTTSATGEFDVHGVPTLPESGRGLGVIARTMDEVTYLSHPDRNVLTLVRRRN